MKAQDLQTFGQFLYLWGVLFITFFLQTLNLNVVSFTPSVLHFVLCFSDFPVNQFNFNFLFSILPFCTVLDRWTSSLPMRKLKCLHNGILLSMSIKHDISMICRDHISYIFHFWRWHCRHGNWIDRFRYVAFDAEYFSFSQQFPWLSLVFILHLFRSLVPSLVLYNVIELHFSRLVSSLLMDKYPNCPSSVGVSCR